MSDTASANRRRAIVIVGGDRLHPALVPHLDPGALLIAADSGFDHALAAGLQPDVLIGDLDSISEAGREATRRRGVEVVEHSPDKDATDTELALDRALAEVGAAGAITMIGGGGDRLDHLLASLAVLAMPRFASCSSLTAWMGPARIDYVHGPRTWRSASMPAGVTLSLLPLDDTDGVLTTGLRWPLHREPLPLGTSRGVSNVTDGGPVTVGVATGVVAVVVANAIDLPPRPTFEESP